jgi:hypothetical protein
MNGTNNLTSKLSCFDDNNGGGTVNLTKYYSVNVIGVSAKTTNNTTGTTSAEEVQHHQSFTIDTNNTASAISNETRVVKDEVKGKDNISSLISIPIPLVANNFTLDRVNVNITSHKSGQEIPVGNFTIVGHSSDNLATDCIVYAGWHGLNPLQIAKALGPGGVNDYSWTFIYTPTYHEITKGTNELTAQISCLDDDNKNNNGINKNNNTNAALLTKYYNTNVTGIIGSSSTVREIM